MLSPQNVTFKKAINDKKAIRSGADESSKQCSATCPNLCISQAVHFRHRCDNWSSSRESWCMFLCIQPLHVLCFHGMYFDGLLSIWFVNKLPTANRAPGSADFSFYAAIVGMDDSFVLLVHPLISPFVFLQAIVDFSCLCFVGDKLHSDSWKKSFGLALRNQTGS